MDWPDNAFGGDSASFAKGRGFDPLDKHLCLFRVSG